MRAGALARAIALVIATSSGLVGLVGEGSPRPFDQTISSTTTDRNDTAGRLDIARVADRIAVLPGRVAVSYSVRTYARLAGDRLRPDQRTLVLELNRDAQAGSERNISIASVEGSLVARVISNATREVVGVAAARQVDDRSIRVSGTRRLIGARAYFWTSNFHAARSSRCGHDDGFPITCQDSVPDAGWLRLDRPAWPRTS